MDPVALAASKIAGARRVAALTGAGISAASGVPTFRGADGLWKKIRAETLATPEAFEHDPTLVWEWYDWRRAMIAGLAPNPAHDVLAAWTRTRPGFTLITQNVDGLLERAGADPVVRLHGSLWHLRCARPDACAPGREDWRDDTAPLPTLPPRCPHCGGMARPAVTWFGEPLPAGALETAIDAAGSADVFLTIGTSAVVYPAASLVPLARRHGAFAIEINADATPASDRVDLAIRGRAEITLAQISDAIGSWG